MLLTSSLHGYFIEYQCLCRYVGNVGNGASYSYTFTYDGVNRMLNATHGTGAYTEKVTAYDKNGNIKALQRYGNGLIDNLTYTYSGNQLTKVEDATGNAAGFSNGASAANEYTYDNNGNLTKDSNKNISSIEYNSLNLPSVVTFSGGNSITYTYAVDGTKLRTVHKMDGVTVTTDYCSNVIYESGAQKRLLTEEGYVDLSASTPTYYYYLKDHQGNNRVVINSSGTVQETNHYYPFGSVFASTGNVQPYKYNGKELDTKCGLNWYDYGARHYDAVLGRWFVVDPLAEKMCAWSPYAYCFNNSIKFIDNNGEVPNVVIGAIIGGIVSGSMAIYDGKDYKEVLAATAGGAVGGAIAATGAAFLGGFIGDVTEQIANLITDSKQDLDYNSMLVSSVTGSVFGKVGDTFESTIKKASSNMMNSIDTKYRSSKFQKTIKEEIKREVSTTGQRIGNASRKQINSKTNERIKALKKSDETFIEGVKNVVNIFIESVNSYFNNIVNNRIKENEKQR